MDIIFAGKYKSLKEFEWSNIPDLAILTGRNGTGKSQLLQIISEAYQNLARNQNRLTNVYTTQEYQVKFENIDFVRSGLLSWKSGGGNFYFEQNKFGYQDLKKICQFLLKYIDEEEVQNSIQQEQSYIDEISNKVNEGNFSDPHPAFTRLFHTLQSKGRRIIDEIVIASGKKKNDLLPADIIFHLPVQIITEDTDLINQDNLDMIFYIFLYKKLSLRNQKKDTSIIGEAPWIILNKVIESAGIPYKIMIPDEKHIQSVFDDPLNELNPYQFSAKLINPTDGTDIGINNLSSGERVIMSLALLLYYFEYRGFKKNILLLDEIDAHLHPSMTKQFFDVINNVVIKEYGAKVIMATHSPSTVALAPTESLFIIKKEADKTTIKEVNKDEALGILTLGVPSLSINYQNRKQVFVESKYDAEYYDKVYNFIKPHLQPEISLNFISSGVSGRGDCHQVKDIVNKLQSAGNHSIYGIVDWDTKNEEEQNIKVLGYNKRYSIENYIFDPVLLGFYLLREKIVTNEELGLDQEKRYLNYTKFGSLTLQTITDKILDKIMPHFKSMSITSISEVEYVNGICVNIPDWFLKNNGHEISEILFKTFPSLHKLKDENGLRKDVINKTISDIPELIPVDLLEIFKLIQGRQ